MRIIPAAALQLETQPTSSVLVLSAAHAAFPAVSTFLACPAGWFSAQGCSAGDLSKYQLCASNGTVLDDGGTCTVKGGCAAFFRGGLVLHVSVGWKRLVCSWCCNS